jgi:hypothetical protein
VHKLAVCDSERVGECLSLWTTSFTVSLSLTGGNRLQICRMPAAVLEAYGVVQLKTNVPPAEVTCREAAYI